MKAVLGCLLALAVFLPAENKPPNTLKRLASVTWDLNSHKLGWVVETGSKVNGHFVPASSQRYEVSPDEASMALGEEKRGFTEEEAASLNNLLDVLSLYCAESTVWWEQGEGAPMEKKTTAPPTPEGKPVRVNRPLPADNPFRTSARTMVAANRVPE